MPAPALRRLFLLLLAVIAVQSAHAQVVLRDTLTLNSPRVAGTLRAEAPPLPGMPAARATAAPIAEGCTYSNGIRSGWRGFWTTEPFLDLNVEFRPLSDWPDHPLSTFVWHTATIQSLYIDYELYTPLDPYSYDREGEYTVEHAGAFVPFAYWHSTPPGTTIPQHNYVMGYDPIHLAEWSAARYIVPVFYFHDGTEWQSIRRDCTNESYASLPLLPGWTTDVTAYESNDHGASVLDLCINWDPSYPTPSAYCSIGQHNLIVRFRGDKKYAELEGTLAGAASRDALFPFWLGTYGRAFSPPGYPSQYVHGRMSLPADTLWLDLCRNGTCATGDELGRVVQVVGGDTVAVPLGQPVPFATLQPEGSLGGYPLFYDGSTATDSSVFWLTVRTRVNDVPQSEREELMGVLAATCSPGEGARGTSCPATTVRLLAQNDEPVTGGYVMVSKVRPDWLLPATSGFVSAHRGTPFEGNALPDSTGGNYDPHTYRAEITGVSDSLQQRSADLRFRYTINSARAYEFPGAVASGDTLRSVHLVRLVSNGRPASGTAPLCSPWPDPSATLQIPGGACQYDDEIASDHTIRVRLGDRLRVTAYVAASGGTPADTLGSVTLPVGQPASEDGDDAIRRVRMRWYQYTSTGYTSPAVLPDTAAARMSEDWAQASIVFERVGSVQTFSADSLLTAARLSVPASGALGRDTLLVSIPPFADTLRVPVATGESTGDIAQHVAEALSALVGQVVYVSGGVDQAGNPIQYIAFSHRRAGALLVQSPLSVVRILDAVETLENAGAGSKAATAAGVAVSDTTLSVIHTVAVPRLAIQQGDSASFRVGYAPRNTPTPLLLSMPEVAVGNDNNHPHVLAHEAGHLLFVLDMAGQPGGSECGTDPDQLLSHHPAPTNLMHCVTMGQGELTGGPKRLTPAQHTALRNEQRLIGDRTLLHP